MSLTSSDADAHCGPRWLPVAYQAVTYHSDRLASESKQEVSYCIRSPVYLLGYSGRRTNGSVPSFLLPPLHLHPGSQRKNMWWILDGVGGSRAQCLVCSARLYLNSTPMTCLYFIRIWVSVATSAPVLQKRKASECKVNWTLSSRPKAQRDRKGPICSRRSAFFWNTVERMWDQVFVKCFLPLSTVCFITQHSVLT